MFMHQLSMLQWVPFQNWQNPNFLASHSVPLTIRPLPTLLDSSYASSHLFLALCSSHKGLIAAFLTYCFSCFCCNLANLLWTKPSCLILSLVNSYSSFKAQATLMKLCSLPPNVLDFSNDFIINYLNVFPLDWEPDKVKGCVFSHLVLISINR